MILSPENQQLLKDQEVLFVQQANGELDIDQWLEKQNELIEEYLNTVN